MTSMRRITVISATAAMGAVMGMALLAGCSSTSDPTPSSPSPSPLPASSSSQMLPPVIINSDETTATAKVGDNLDILASDNAIAGTTVSTDRPDLVALTQSHDDGSAQFNPGGKVLAAGTAVITVTNPDGSTREITLTITP